MIIVNKRYSIVVLISGNGSNLQAIIDAVNSNHLSLTIAAVISSNPNAIGLERAKNAHIPCHIHSYENFNSRNEYDKILCEIIGRYTPDLIVLAGFMRILGHEFLTRFRNKIINIHPSLLPQYPGLNTHEQVINNNNYEHGCSIHYVNENLDGGPLIAQAIIKVKPEDNISSLKQNVQRAEHFLYPTILNWLTQHRLKLQLDQVFFDSVLVPQTGLKFIINNNS